VQWVEEGGGGVDVVVGGDECGGEGMGLEVEREC